MSLLTEREKQIIADHEWARMNEDLIKQHGGHVVAVHKKKVLGVGQSHKEAIDAALQSLTCPARETIAVVPLPVRLPGKPLVLDDFLLTPVDPANQIGDNDVI